MPSAEKILASIKGLQEHMRAGEEPLATIPGIWDAITTGASERSAATCEIVLTNQRLLGYMYTKFPRERLFLEAFALADITNIAFRQKSFEPLFRELAISDGLRTTYIRSSREKIESLSQDLQAAITTYAPHATTSPQQAEERILRPAPVYEKKTIRTSFEQSLSGIAVLFTGGLVLEIVGASAWAVTHSIQVGLPLCVAGFVAVFFATLARRQRK